MSVILFVLLGVSTGANKIYWIGTALYAICKVTAFLLRAIKFVSSPDDEK